MKRYRIDNTSIIVTKHIPVHGYVAMACYGRIIWRAEHSGMLEAPGYEGYVKGLVNHEGIHTAQMRDFCPWIPVGGTIFYIVYFCEWLYRLVTIRRARKAYEAISFEREAYTHQQDHGYLQHRKPFAQWRKG